MDKKRVIYIIIFIVASILLGYAVYRVFFARKTSDIAPRTTETSSRKGYFPATGQGKPVKPTPGKTERLPISKPRAAKTFQAAPPKEQEVHIVDASIVSPNIDGSGNTRFYNKEDGLFYRVGRDGKPQAMSDEEFFNVEKVTWSPTKNESIIEYPDGNNIYYNFTTKKKVTLPKHWEDFSFSNLGDQIAAKSITLDPENRYIITSNPDGSNIRFIEEMGDNDKKVNVDWSPNGQIVALSRTGRPMGAERQEVLFIGQNHENFKSIIVEGRGLQSKWSAEGKQLLYSVHSKRSGFKPELWITDAQIDNIGANRRPLFINTWADKCTFASERYLYCGVPKELEFGSGLQPSLADNTAYDIYKIDLKTSRKTKITLENFHTIDKIFVSEDGKIIQFTDTQQDGLFRVNL